MRQFCALRSESIAQQLINGETATNMGYVDASALTLSSMGSMGGMGGVGGRSPGENNARPSRENMQMPGNFAPGMTGTGSAGATPGGGIWLAVSAIVLCIGILVAKFYKL